MVPVTDGDTLLLHFPEPGVRAVLAELETPTGIDEYCGMKRENSTVLISSILNDSPSAKRFHRESGGEPLPLP